MGSLFSKKPKAKLDMQAADYRQAVKQRTDSQRDAANALLKQLETERTGPSLSGMQLKAASGKNLQELLAAAASRRGSSPTAQLVNMGKSAETQRAIGAEAAKAGVQEMSQKQKLAADLAVGQQRQDLAQIMQPGQLLAEQERKRFEADSARNRQIGRMRDMVNTAALTGGGSLIGSYLMGGGGSQLSSMMGGGGGFSGGTTGTASFGAGTAGGSGSAIGGGVTAQPSPYFGFDGGVVPGDIPGKANSPDYDVVDAKLSPGEIILPRSVSKDKDAPAKAKAFVKALQDSQQKEKKQNSEQDFLREARRQAIKALLNKGRP